MPPAGLSPRPRKVESAHEPAMADILLRDLAEDTKVNLRRRAASHQRAMNAQLRDIVSTALAQHPHSDRAALKQLAADIRALSAGRVQTPSEDLLRESRDGHDRRFVTVRRLSRQGREPT